MTAKFDHSNILRVVPEVKRKETLIVTQTEMARLRAIEDAFNLILNYDTREVRELPIREWANRMEQGRRAAHAEGWLTCAGSNRCHGTSCLP